MRARAWGCLAAAACALAGPLAAQQTGDKARLDDFAVPASDQQLRVEQITTPPFAPPPTQVRDRMLASVTRVEAASTATVQLTIGDQGGDVAQLATRGQSRTALSGAVGNPRDRVPGAVQRIGGQDRCDPAQERQAYAECLRILELRADEFHAPEAPSLSPEQRLLGEMRQPDERLSGPNGALRMRTASSGQLDADLQSNQELAAVVLATQPTAVAPAETSQPDEASALADVLQALGVQVTAPPTGN